LKKGQDIRVENLRVCKGYNLMMSEGDDKLNFTVFAEDCDLHGVRQVTRAENGVVGLISNNST